MSRITEYSIFDSTYDEYTAWFKYTDGKQTGYEMVNKTVQAEVIPALLEATDTFDKININDCSKWLQALIISSKESENEMYFLEHEDQCNYFNTTSTKEINIILDKLRDEVIKLELENYIRFDEDDCVVTVYGGITTKFMFS